MFFLVRAARFCCVSGSVDSLHFHRSLLKVLRGNGFLLLTSSVGWRSTTLGIQRCNCSCMRRLVYTWKYWPMERNWENCTPLRRKPSPNAETRVATRPFKSVCAASGCWQSGSTTASTTMACSMSLVLTFIPPFSLGHVPSLCIHCGSSRVSCIFLQQLSCICLVYA